MSEENKEVTEYEKAAASYAGQLNYFKKALRRKGISAKKLARIFIACAEFPLGEMTRLLDSEERFIFQLFHTIQASKNQFLEELLKKNKGEEENVESTEEVVAESRDNP